MALSLYVVTYYYCPACLLVVCHGTMLMRHLQVYICGTIITVIGYQHWIIYSQNGKAPFCGT